MLHFAVLYCRKNQIKDNNCIIYLAVAGKEIIGSVLATPDTRKGWINRLAVVPEYRRKGIASSLVIKAEQWLENKGIEIVACLIQFCFPCEGDSYSKQLVKKSRTRYDQNG